MKQVKGALISINNVGNNWIRTALNQRRDIAMKLVPKHRDHVLNKFKYLSKLLDNATSCLCLSDLSLLEGDGADIFHGNRLVGRLYVGN